MEVQSKEILDQLNLFPLISKLLSIKFPKISYFTTCFYLYIITKLQPKIFKLKAISSEQFKDLILQQDINFVGDVHACVLISINTLLALSVSNRSWLKITKFCSHIKSEKLMEREGNHYWKIKMPPIGKDEKNNKKNYLVQCICLPNNLKDFVLYLTDLKFCNILNYTGDNFNCFISDHKVKYEGAETDYLPKTAETIMVAGLNSENDLNTTDYEKVLNEYFVQPKYLRAGDVFCVTTLVDKEQLLSKSNLCYNVYFKVITITGDSDAEEYYVVKGLTNLYIKPSVHGYLPPKNTCYIKTHKNFSGFELSLCVDGLNEYHEKLVKVCRPFLLSKNFQKKLILLLCGPKGSGKKTTVKSLASFYGLHLLQVNCFDLYGLNPSHLQGKLEQLFAKARRTVPCIIYLNHVELLGREQNYKENERLIDIFKTQIEELWLRKPNTYPLIIIGSTELKTSDIVPSIARLFIHKISFKALNSEKIYQILNWLIRNSNLLSTSSTISYVAEKVKSYTFGDLALLVKQAIYSQAMECNKNESENHFLSKRHFDKAIDLMEAAYSDSIGAARVPFVYWDDVGGLEDLKDEIMLTLNLPLKHPELFSSVLKRSGILFYGPPGTGKTLMAKAVATECNYNFLSVKGPELMNMYVGQSEKNVREVFGRAREAAPCIIFFDELDSLAPSRGKSGDSGGVTDRVVSQLLAEMDGLEKNKDVFVIAATNRPDLIDPALFRPGRFDKMFYVGVCTNQKSKLSVLKALTRRFRLGLDVNFEKIINDLPDLVTGADLYSLCSNAWLSALRRAINAIEMGTEVSMPLDVFSEDFSNAVQQFVPSLTLEDIEYFEKLKFS